MNFIYIFLQNKGIRNLRSALVQGPPKFFVRGPHKILHNSSRAGRLK